MRKVKLQSLAHPDWPYVCDQYCKVHWYWDFDTDQHQPLPAAWNIKTEAGWINQVVWVGPPGYLPKKPTEEQWTIMAAHCPHTQADLTCNTCLRHTFRLVEL